MGATSANGAAPHRPQKGTGRSSAPRRSIAGSAGKRPARRATGTPRSSAQPRSRSADPHRVRRTRYGYPTVSERLARQARRAGARRRSVIGSTVQHNGSLGYISRGRFGGSRRRRAVRAQMARFAPVAALVCVALVCAGAVGYAVQGAWNPFAMFQGAGADLDVFPTVAAQRMADAAAPTARAAAASDAVVLDAGRVTDTGNGRVTFSAVGDNLANENLLELADAAAGSTGDDAYDFSGFYEQIAPAIASYDIAFINQETTLGGPDAYGYNGYPSYNTPDAMADAVADVGWRVVSTNTNHTYDTWTASIEHAQQVWGAKSAQLLTIGSFTSQEDRERPRVVECNGVRIAFLSYSYGQNGYEQSDLPNDYYAVPYDHDAMKGDVQRARRAADAVVVYMHWGTEYEHEPDETQRARAQELADAGVDLVIGSHAHVIQPMAWLDGADGGRTLVVYGLGDFLSGYFDSPECVLSGMFTCTFTRADGAGDAAGGNAPARAVTVEDPVWHPVIEHWQDNQDTIYLMEDYTDELARANELLAGIDDPYQWLRDTTTSVIGDEFTIAW